MERPEKCPSCLSKYREIHGLLYKEGGSVGSQCGDVWHKADDYPNSLELTEEDRDFLAGNRIQP